MPTRLFGPARLLGRSFSQYSWLLPWPNLVTATVAVMVTVTATDTAAMGGKGDTDTITARGLLMLTLMLTDTDMAVDTVMAVMVDTVDTTVDTVIIVARGPLMLKPKPSLLLKPMLMLPVTDT